MNKKWIILPFLAITFAAFIAFMQPAKETTLSEDITKVEDFTLLDFNGESHTLSDYKDSEAIVLLFIATECPISNDYNKRMANLPKKYQDKNVAFIGINPNKSEPAEEVKSHAEKNGFTFPVLKDEKNIIADKLKASVTPEIYILNSNFDVLYQGRIDDSRKGDNITSRDLENALDEILSGKKVSNNRTKAFGCTIKRV
jgi:peroxiredoxin